MRNNFELCENIISVLLVLFSFVGCQKDISSRNPALLLYANANDVYYYYHDPIEQLSYTVDTEYPAKEVVGWVKDQLAIQRWKPLEESYLNPGIKSSHVSGWDSFIDGTVHPRLKVHQWLADWENIDGDILTCGFRYEYPENGEKDLKTYLFISGIPRKRLRNCQIKASNMLLEN